MKLFYLCDGNLILDIIPEKASQNSRQVAECTLDFHKKLNEKSWLNPYILEVESEGELTPGKTNIVTTILLNNKPVKAIINQFRKVSDEVEGYINGDYDSEYRKYKVVCEFVRG